jgi:hypothetical protein
MNVQSFENAGHLIKQILEVLNLISGIAVGIAAIVALKQLKIGVHQAKIARDAIRIAAARESFKLAADQCHRFGEQIIPQFNRLAQELSANQTTFILAPFKVKDGEIAELNMERPALKAYAEKLGSNSLIFLNSMESFAMFFTSKVADENVAYREAGISFCALVEYFVPLIQWNRLIGDAPYASTIELYELWHERLEHEKLIKEKNQIDKSLQRVKPRTISPLGTEHEFNQ